MPTALKKQLPVVAHHFSQPSAASSVQTAGRSAGSQSGRLATFQRRAASAKNPASAVMTPESAQDASCAGLRARIRRALDVSRLPNSGFVARQITIHQEFTARQTQKTSVATRLQTSLNHLEKIAAREEWSQRKLAAKVGVKESTFRLIKRGDAPAEKWLPKLEVAVARLMEVAR